MTSTKSLKNITVALILTMAAIVIGMSLSTLRVAHATSRPANMSVQGPSEIVVSANSGPFRDGLYQAKLAKEHGSEQHIAVGRWASQEHRAAYAAGYLQGYNAPVAAASASRGGNRQFV